MNIDRILADFQKMQSACEDLEGTKILVGIVGEADSEIIKVAHAQKYGDGKLSERSFIRASFNADQEKLDQTITSALNKMIAG